MGITIQSGQIQQVDSTQLKAMASAIRLEILDCLAATGESMSIREVAKELHRRPDSLYFHFGRLVEVGLIRQDAVRQLRRHTEALFSVPQGLRLRYDLEQPETRTALASMASAMLRVATRDFKAGVESERAQPWGSQRNLWNARVAGRLNQRQLHRVNELLCELLDLFSEGAGGADSSERVSLVWSLAPGTSGSGSRDQG